MYNNYIKRVLDFWITLIALVVFSPVFLILIIAIKIDSKGPILFKQKRVGKNKEYFNILKFRTMKIDTPKDCPTHLLENPEQYITRVGKIMRKTSLDELPQLINIIKGDMSIIGPRPALWNQYDLIDLRDKVGANDITPGLTGWAQINGRDEIELDKKAGLDGEYAKKLSFAFDLKCFFGTILSVLKHDGVSEGGPKSDKKKVLFSATVDSHILHFHLPYLKMFKEEGYEVHVATNGDEEIPYCDVKHKISFERSPFRINNLRAIGQMKKVLKSEKFDIIHTHTPMGGVVTRIAAKKFRKDGTRVIYTAHGFHFYKGAPIINWLLFYPIEKHLAKCTDDLITINTEDYELAKKKFKTKVYSVPGVGVDPEKFNFEITKQEKNKFRKQLGLDKDDVVLIYVAELNKNKNQKMAIEAMELLVKENKNYKLLLIGQDSYNGFYQDMAKNLKLEKNILFLGYRTDVPKLFKVSDIDISTSLREGLPVNLIEANMSNLPVIATNCRGNRDLGDIVINFNSEELYQSIINVQNKEKRFKFKKSYSLNDVSKKMKKIYKI